MDLTIEPSAAAACEKAARIIADLAARAPASVLALPTGRTPLAVYDTLARWQRDGVVDLRRLRSFNLDELVGLPPDDPRSYAAYMVRHWQEPLGVPAAHVHLPQVMASDLGAASAAYEDRIAMAGGLDLALLGIGENGHVAFNEPGTPWNMGTHVCNLADSTRQILRPAFGSLDLVPRQAVTMGMRTILSARHCVLLATGAAKAAIVARALEGPPTEAVPASALRSHPRVTVILDRAAASALETVADEPRRGSAP